MLDAVFSLYGTVDMTTPYLPFLGATDASTEYGHGATIAPLSDAALRRISRLSCKAGDYVALLETLRCPRAYRGGSGIATT